MAEQQKTVDPQSEAPAQPSVEAQAPETTAEQTPEKVTPESMAPNPIAEPVVDPVAEKPKPKKSPSAKKPAAKGDDKPQPIKGLNAVAVRNNYYRDGYRMLKLAAVFQAMIALVLGLVILYLVNTQEIKYVYFATTEDGRLVKMSALSEPNLSTPALMSWSAQAVSQTMTFGFHDYKKRLQESSRFFTRAGWSKFTQALEKSGIMTAVESNQQVVTAAPKRAPVIVREGVKNGRYEWYVEIPMSITYKAGAKVRAESPLVRLKIVRVPKLENAHGVGIEQWIQ